MTTNKTGAHTPSPGPWSFEYDAAEIRDADGEFVTHVATSRYVDDREDPRALANARLIAAAPQLLEALQAVLPYVSAGEALIVRAAIEAATGGTP